MDGAVVFVGVGRGEQAASSSSVAALACLRARSGVLGLEGPLIAPIRTAKTAIWSTACRFTAVLARNVTDRVAPARVTLMWAAVFRL